MTVIARAAVKNATRAGATGRTYSIGSKIDLYRETLSAAGVGVERVPVRHGPHNEAR